MFPAPTDSTLMPVTSSALSTSLCSIPSAVSPPDSFTASPTASTVGLFAQIPPSQ